jgi:hypothetical protein
VAHTVKLDDGSVALFQVSQVRVGASANPELERQLATFLQQRSAAGDLVAYFDEVRRRAKVEKSTKVFGE